MAKKHKKLNIDTSTISEVKARINRQGANQLMKAWLGKEMDGNVKTVNVQSLQDKARNKVKEAQRKIEERKLQKIKAQEAKKVVSEVISEVVSEAVEVKS